MTSLENELHRLLTWTPGIAKNVAHRYLKANNDPLRKEEEHWWGGQRRKAETLTTHINDLTASVLMLKNKYQEEYGEDQIKKANSRRIKKNQRKGLKRCRSESKVSKGENTGQPLLKKLFEDTRTKIIPKNVPACKTHLHFGAMKLFDRDFHVYML